MRLPSALLATLLLAACGTFSGPAEVPLSGAKVWYSIEDGVGLTPDERESLSRQLEAALAPVRAAPGSAGAQHLKVAVVSYRMIDDTTRPADGMVQGSDHVASVVRRIDPAGGRVLSETRVLTRASKTLRTPDALLRAHADEVARVAMGGD